MDIVYEIGVVIIVSGVVGVIGYFLKQPLILAYILAGFIIGPYGFGFINDTAFIDGVAEVGVVLLLFLIGLEMNISRLKDVGKLALAIGFFQGLFTGGLGYLLSIYFGFSVIQSVYIAVVLLFSSTVISVKLLSDKKDTKSLYGQICIGILIIQDVIAIIALLVLGGLGDGGFVFDAMFFALLGGVVVAVLSTFIANHGLKYLYSKIATSHELLVLFSISWCFIIALVCYEMGLSMEIGAFIAGLNLANLPYAFEINSKTKILRDFFITVFFVSLGASIVFGDIGNYVWPVIALITFVMIVKPLIVMVTMGSMGYDKRTLFFTSLNIGNISEFSLIVATLGKSLGHIGDDLYVVIAVVAIVTMVLSSYLMTNNKNLYSKLSKALSFFEFKKTHLIKKKTKKLMNHIVLLGCDQIGEQILEQIIIFKENYIVVDNDNNVIKKLMDEEIHCIFGDIADDDLIDELDLEDAELIISTVPDMENNSFILQRISSLPKNKKPLVIAMSNSGREGIDMFTHGVDYVIVRPYLSAHHIHQIHSDIYNLNHDIETEKKLTKDKILKKVKNNHHTDVEISKIIHNLNSMKLKEIKSKLDQKILKFTKVADQGTRDKGQGTKN